MENTATGLLSSMVDNLRVLSTNTDVLILEPKVFSDGRGFFMESFNSSLFAEVTGVKTPFVQDNHSYSKKNVLRGLHYQIPHAQGKLVRLITGSVFDVAVDLRKSSPNYGHWTGLHLVAEKQQLIWIPPGFAHGFYVTSENAHFLYKTTDYYQPSAEHCLKWNDPTVGIQWPFNGEPIISFKDDHGKRLHELPTYN